MGKISLPNVTLIAVAGNKQAETIASMYKSMAKVDFGAAKLITNINISCSGIDVLNVGGLETWEKYNEFIVWELYKHFDTDYCLIVQHDSWVLDETCWTDEFFEFDVVGAKWLDIGKPFNTSNGGFTLRSKRLQTVLGTDRMIRIATPEDVAINKVYGSYLKNVHGIRFCTEEIADKFSFELNQPLAPTFGFHSWHWESYKPTVLIKRMYALGDLLQTEPVMHYYHKKGYNVALETNPEFYGYFRYHYFPITPKENLNPDLPVTEIDLQMAYEVFPQKLHLESFYDFAQVPKEEKVYRNPMLSLSFNYKHPQFKLFKKYVVFHIDERQEPHRNLYGIEWAEVAALFKNNGYDCIQVGAGKHEKIEGAVFMNTPTPDMLMWVVASSDMFCGIDSGVSHIASGFDIPSVIFSGSVDLRLIHADLSNKLWIHNHDKNVCNQPYCWHNAGVTEIGQDCYVDKEKPPCVQFSTDEVLTKIENYINEQNTINRRSDRLS